jgi:hypothetical protein
MSRVNERPIPYTDKARTNHDKIFKKKPFCFGWQTCDLEYRKYCKHCEKCKKEADNG